MELQRGVCGDLAAMSTLSDEVAAVGVVAATGALLDAARNAGVAVVHCTFSLLADRSGTPMNSPLMKVLARNPDHMLDGTAATDLIAGLDGAGDARSNRHHGFSPFIGTDLDPLLQSRGTTTVVLTGVSLNLGIPGAVIEAINSGYRVVVARDCVAGVPADYGALILDQTISMLATIATSEQLRSCWT